MMGATRGKEKNEWEETDGRHGMTLEYLRVYIRSCRQQRGERMTVFSILRAMFEMGEDNPSTATP